MCSTLPRVPDHDVLITKNLDETQLPIIRDHSLFIADGGLVRMKGVTQDSRQSEGDHRKYANRCVN